MVHFLEGFIPYKEEDAAEYNKNRWWAGLTIGDILDRAADIHPNKEAFVDNSSQITYAQARDSANRLAIGLLDKGVKPLDRVLVQLPNWNEFVFVYFALQKIGAIPVLLIDRYRQFEINRLIKLTGARAWIVASKYRKTDYIPVINDVLLESSGIKQVFVVREKKEDSPFVRIEDLIKGTQLSQNNMSRLEQIKPDPMQVAHMGPTGGTTGSPKIVPRTHNSLVTCVDYCSRCWDQSIEDINLIAGPIGHDLSFTKGFLGSVVTQGKVVFLDTTTDEDICQTIEAEKVTSIIWVPALAQRMLQYEKLGDYDLSSLKKMHSAGAASHPDLVYSVIHKLNMKFYNGYGATEGMTTITRTIDEMDTICSTVGRPTCPYDRYKVIGFNEEALSVNEEGELVVKGPGVFTGYYNNPDENKKAFTKDGFFKTGDVAKINKEGYITLTGRIKEMINRGGESISTKEIEGLIIEHPQVASVAVVPMPDPKLGERACAYIETTSQSKLTFDDIIAFLKSKQASVLQLPERIEFIDIMPHTPAQKVDKTYLKKDIEKKLNQNL